MGIRAALIGFLGVIIVIVVPMILDTGGESDVRLVDISFDERPVGFPRVDVKIRNTGTKVAFVKRANFRVEKVWKLTSFLKPSAVPVSWHYDVVLPVGGAPYVVPKDISQSIAPNEVDRFTFTLGNDAQPGHDVIEYYVVLMTLELVCDEDNKSVPSGKLLHLTAR